jgi:hypothetical protein
LEGTIGQNAVRLFVETAGYPKEAGLWGMYFYTRYWTPIPLEGEQLSANSIQLLEGDPSDSPLRPRFDLTMSGEAVTGTWTSADGRRGVPVHLRRVAQPAAYDTAIRNAQRFTDVRWPMEFSYPVGWFLKVTGTTLVLRSPDPEDMLSDNVLTCERGRGLPSAPPPEGEPVHFQGSYYRTHDGWRVEEAPGPGANCDDGPTCASPTVRKVRSTLLMSAEASYRVFGPWGYGGLADSREYLVIDGSEWAHCFDRLLDSNDRIQPRAKPRPKGR